MLSKNRQAFGVRQGHARLDDKAVVAIHADLSSGLLHREIAKQYNVARTTISAINVKRTWKHV
jgi:IS30 family transposase